MYLERKCKHCKMFPLNRIHVHTKKKLYLFCFSLQHFFIFLKNRFSSECLNRKTLHDTPKNNDSIISDNHVPTKVVKVASPRIYAKTRERERENN